MSSSPGFPEALVVAPVVAYSLNPLEPGPRNSAVTRAPPVVAPLDGDSAESRRPWPSRIKKSRPHDHLRRALP